MGRHLATLVRRTQGIRVAVSAGLVVAVALIVPGTPVAFAAGPPTLALSFSPTTVYGQQATTMTITISDVNDGTSMALTSNFNNTFPTQMVVASAPASTTCRNAANTANAVIRDEHRWRPGCRVARHPPPVRKRRTCWRVHHHRVCSRHLGRRDVHEHHEHSGDQHGHRTGGIGPAHHHGRCLRSCL